MAIVMHWRSLSSRIFHTAVVVLLVGLTLAQSRPTFAQGTTGILPDPISTYELKGYADRLKLSPQQRLAADAMHDQYKQDFRALRQGEIAAFMKDMMAMQGNVMPKREVMESFMKRMDLLQGRIATLDSRLFDQLQTILTDEQMAMMGRVRLARQRARYSANQMMWMTGNRAADLSEIVLGMEIPAEHAAAIDSTLSGYEGRLTSSMAKLYDATSNMIMKIFDTMEEKGFTEQDMSDPENMQKFGEAMQQIWKDLMLQAVEAAADLSDVNQRTYRSLASALPEEKARELRNAYYTQAFPEAAFALADETMRFTEALKLESLTAEQRDALTAARIDLQQKLDRVADDVVKLIEEQRKNFSPFDFNSESMQEHYRKIQEYQKKVEDTRASAKELLTTILGEEQAQQVEKAAVAQASKAAGGLSSVMRAAMEKAEAARVDAADAEANQYLDDATSIQQAWTGDQFVAPPISRNELKRYAEILKIADDQQELLTQLHATYLENFKKVQETEIAALTKAVQSMWTFNIETQTTTAPTDASLDATEKARRAAIDAVARVDELFFADVQLALLDDKVTPDLQRVRLMRERERLNRGTEHMWAMAGRVGENRIDLSSFLQKQPLSESDRAARAADLLEYEQAAMALFRERFDAALAMQHAQDRWQIEMQRAQSENENQFKVASRYQEILGEPSKRVSQASNAIVKLNREWIEKILAKLPSDTSAMVRQAYNRAAFPNVYNDPLALELQLNEAAKLPDLGPEQVRRVNEIAGDYRPAYTNLCEQMAEVSASGSMPSFAMGMDDSDAWKQWQERREALASLRFDRDELCMRTINRLKAILSEDQIKRLGGMPEPSKRQPYEDFME